MTDPLPSGKDVQIAMGQDTIMEISTEYGQPTLP